MAERFMERFLSVLLLWVCVPVLALAQTALPNSADPALEARVMVIAEELRCLVCQNETIAASHAELAVDLRQQIRSQLQQGRTAQEILDFMSQRYGDFVLYRPELKPMTWLLWFGPFVLLLGAVAGLGWYLRQRRKLADRAPAMSDAERARVDQWLKD